MPKKISREDLIVLLKESNYSGNAPIKLINGVRKAVLDNFDDTELMTEILKCERVAWIALGAPQMPFESIIEAFQCNTTKARQEALRSEYGTYIYKCIGDNFESSDYTGLLGNKGLPIDLFNSIKSKMWDYDKIVFIDSNKINDTEMIDIIDSIKCSELKTSQDSIGISNSFKGIVDIWNRLLDNNSLSDNLIEYMFNMKDYWVDTALMNHRRTPDHIKNKIIEIMNNHKNN